MFDRAEVVRCRPGYGGKGSQQCEPDEHGHDSRQWSLLGDLAVQYLVEYDVNETPGSQRLQDPVGEVDGWVLGRRLVDGRGNDDADRVHEGVDDGGRYDGPETTGV